MITDAKSYFKKKGWKLGASPSRLDRLFHQSLNEEGKALFESYTESVRCGHADVKDLYRIPQTAKQAALIFSGDSSRSVASVEWIHNFLKKQKPGRVLEMGCGPGFSLDYLSQRLPKFYFEGLEAATNLASIASELSGLTIWNSNYLLSLPEEQYDYIVCDFGWDSSDIQDAPAPHVLKEVSGHEYCVRCTTAAAASFQKMLESWSSILSDRGTLLVTGRLRHLGDIVAFFRAASSCGLRPDAGASSFIYWKSRGMFERAPALIMTRDPSWTEAEIDQEAVAFLEKGRR